MEKTKSKTDTDYVSRLDPVHKQRYLLKLEDVNGFDPYNANQKGLWSKDLQLVPPITYGDIVNYLVFGRSFYTLTQFKNYKSLEAHMQFTNGWVQDVEVHSPTGSDNFVLRSKVLHSQRLNEKMLLPWVIADKEGTIKSAHCTCMAGLAETCTHVAALLFKLETIVRVRERTTVTGEAAYWMIPGSINKVEPMVGYQIDFTTAQEKKKMLDVAIQSGQGSTEKRTVSSTKACTPSPSAAEVQEFFDGLKGNAAAALSVLPGHCDNFVDPIKPVLLPKSLKSVKNSSLDSFNYVDLVNHCKNNISVNISKEQCIKIEFSTRDQQSCSFWYSSKVGRVTASNLYSVFVFDINKPSLSTIKNVCYPQKHLNVPAISWGVQNERNAREQYRETAKKSHANFKVELCGLFIDNMCPYLGASPDALISCECCGKGCLEIKCPYKFRDCTIVDAIKDKNFCLAEEDGKVVLKQDHPYFYQVQCQLFVTKSDYCDFFVWTRLDSRIVRVLFNASFFEKCKEKAEFFFYNVALPELAAEYFTKHRDICNSNYKGTEAGKKRRFNDL